MKYVERISDITGDRFGGWAISRNIYKWLLENIPPGTNILELGSGTGTVELAKHFNMYSIEHDTKWVGYAKKANYIYAPLKHGWYNTDSLSKLLKNVKYDVILIDGPPEKYSKRIAFMEHINLFNIDVTFIIDDTHREGELELCKSLSESLGVNYKIVQSDNKSFGIIKNTNKYEEN